MKIHYSNENKSTHIYNQDGVMFITFEKLEQQGIKHAFSTRLGGISTEYFSTMNLSYHRGDNPDSVTENHRRFSKAVGYDASRLVFSDQVHKTVVYKVTEEDCGKGITRESDINGVDGLMTNVANIPLITFYADCVPLYFYDPVHHAIALAHSGWKGTVARMGAKTLEAMKRDYNTNPQDVIAAVGPSICQKCYEISEGVAEKFRKEFSIEQESQILYPKGNKFHLDLWKANEIILLEAGIQTSNLAITDLCTCCNSAWLYSHRATHGLRGNLAAVMTLE